MRNFILIIFFTTATCCVFSQRTFSGGIIAGPLVSQISGDGLGGWDKAGFAAGAWVNIPFSEKMSLDISMKYVTKGSRTEQDTLSYNTFGYYLNYIDVPLLARYDIVKSKTTYSLLLGPYAGVLLSQKIKFNGNEITPVPEFNSYDLGAQVGVSVWLGKKFFIQGTLSTSVLPTRPNPSITNRNSYYEKGNYNQVLQLLFGFRFGGGSDASKSTN